MTSKDIKLIEEAAVNAKDAKNNPFVSTSNTIKQPVPNKQGMTNTAHKISQVAAAASPPGIPNIDNAMPAVGAPNPAPVDPVRAALKADADNIVQDIEYKAKQEDIRKQMYANHPAHGFSTPEGIAAGERREQDIANSAAMKGPGYDFTGDEPVYDSPHEPAPSKLELALAKDEDGNYKMSDDDYNIKPYYSKTIGGEVIPVPRSELGGYT